MIYIVVETLNGQGAPLNLRAFKSRENADQVFDAVLQETEVEEADMRVIDPMIGTLRYACDDEYAVQIIELEIEN